MPQAKPFLYFKVALSSPKLACQWEVDFAAVSRVAKIEDGFFSPSYSVDKEKHHEKDKAPGEFLFILQTYLSSVLFYKNAQWLFLLPNFVKSHQTSKVPSSWLKAEQIFGMRQNWQIFNLQALIW